MPLIHSIERMRHTSHYFPVYPNYFDTIRVQFMIPRMFDRAPYGVHCFVEGPG